MADNPVFDKVRKHPETGETVRTFAGFPRYSKIKAAQGVNAPALPDDYILPWVQHLFPKDQGGQGSCVGESMAYVMETVYLKLTNDTPSVADKAKAQFHVPESIGQHQTTVDIGYPQTFSDAMCYYKSREIGNVTEPSGSYIDYAIQAAMTYGTCRQWQWWLSQNGTDEWTFPYPNTDPETKEAALVTAANHKIEGAAQCTSPDSIKRAIFDHQWAVESAWEVYENYNQGQSDGHWPPPRGEIVGGHAMAIVGWNKAGEWIVLQSWRGAGWPLLNYLPQEYWTAFIGAIVPLDTHETKFGSVVYTKVTVTCSDEANLSIDGAFYAKGKGFTPDLEIGKQVALSASATGWTETQTVTITVASGMPAVNIVFKNKPPAPPAPPTPPTPPSDPHAAITAALKKINDAIKAIEDALKKK